MEPECKVNRGNLLQHWTLCAAMAALRECYPSDDAILFHVDGHAMKPLSVLGEEKDGFDRVRAGLPGQESRFELAWKRSVPGGERVYPSSAVFADHTWGGPIAYLLCEQDRDRAGACREWVAAKAREGRAVAYEVYEADWRQRFERHARFPLTRLKSGKDVVQEIDPAAVYVSFDPNMFWAGRGVGKRDMFNMYPEDMVKVWGSLQPLEDRPVVLQLSTYSTQGGNTQEKVEKCLTKCRPKGWYGPTVVRAGGNMMSLLFWSAPATGIQIESLQHRFSDWASAHRLFRDI